MCRSMHQQLPGALGLQRELHDAARGALHLPLRLLRTPDAPPAVRPGPRIDCRAGRGLAVHLRRAECVRALLLRADRRLDRGQLPPRVCRDRPRQRPRGARAAALPLLRFLRCLRHVLRPCRGRPCGPAGADVRPALRAAQRLRHLRAVLPGVHVLPDPGLPGGRLHLRQERLLRRRLRPHGSAHGRRVPPPRGARLPLDHHAQGP
mmetsp:Transcript_88185/g.278937  ORF Transcript_88185/g.278937 Transcript_88185/m.278937 type:complete len:206 (-) Transcript_88185:298-915(-)